MRWIVTKFVVSGADSKKSKQNCKISCILFVSFAKMMYFCSRNDKNEQNMSMLNAYFYGYYFYFAGNCEAVGRK